jgi:GNAT superfamily N-acetyltransferase
VGGVADPGDPAFTPPTPIEAEHDLSRFSCGKPDLDGWLRQRALKSEGRSARTYVICRGAAVVAYYSLATGGTGHAGLPGKLRRNMPDPVPMLVLGRLAVDESCHGRGLGSGLLRDAMLRAVEAHKAVGFRAILVHAKDEGSLAFYRRFGFLEYPSGTKTLFLPIETLIAAL